jgi:uncharacterized membrane protein
MLAVPLQLPPFLVRFWASFSFVGLAVASLFFAVSLTPSLLPRHFAVQGILSGFAIAVGYGLGVFLNWLWRYLQIPQPNAKVQRIAMWTATIVVLCVTGVFLWRDSIWQNSIRQRMEMEPVESAYPYWVTLIALATGFVLVVAVRGLRNLWCYVDRKISTVVPPRVSHVVTTAVVVVGLILIANDVVGRLALNAADQMFLRLDQIVDDGIEQPSDPTASGSAQSLIDWNSIGRFGKQFVAAGPTEADLRGFLGRDAVRPLRVYVGLASQETVDQRAELALKELIRVGGFNRSLLVVATPTGTGWLDPGAVDTLEYLHSGDTAIVTMQYSYLPSWLTILVDPARSRESATKLFDKLYDHWKTLPKDNRPRLYLHGLSLGALGSAASADLFTVFEDPIQGGLWSGPPFPSSVWVRATHHRNPGTPIWLPEFRDGSMLRFTGRETTLNAHGSRWGPMRLVFLQHASDPMSFFSPQLLYRKPEWLVGERGPDVSPYLTWFPLVTFLQSAFDLPMATTVPHGYGHNFAPSSYIDSWLEVTQPAGWNDQDTARLKNFFQDSQRKSVAERHQNAATNESAGS